MDESAVREWDERYASHDQMWSGNPNPVLVTEVAGLPPGRALDVGCGEGADALWLAAQGWQVTATDISQVALDRGRAAARDAGLTVDWVQADLVATPPPAGRYDLVSLHYPALPHTPDDDVVRGLVGAVAPNGTLLIVGHALADLQHDHDGHEHHFDPADYVQPADVAGHLDETWVIEVHETRPRTTPPPPGTHHVEDVVLRARRQAVS